MPKQAVPLSYVRFAYRFVYLVLLILGGIILAYILRMALGCSWSQKTPGKIVVRVWMRLVANSLGVRVGYRGKLIDQATLLVSNHVSWLDIIVIGSLFDTRFVSKQEVSHWPVIGYLTRLSGTHFLKRGSVSSLRKSIVELRENFQAGQCVTIFPEGTTSDGTGVLPFHAGLFQAAALAEVPVQPMVIFYHRYGQCDQVAPFIGETTFLEHIVRLMWEPYTTVIVDAGLAQLKNSSSKDLSRQGHDAIASRLGQYLSAPSGHGTDVFPLC